MNVLSKLHERLLKENQIPCTMFWCVPSPSDTGINWEIVTMEAEGDDLGNWPLILHKLKHSWKIDCDCCRDHHSALPRGILVDGILYHGNNLPHGIHLDDIAKEMGYELGVNATPKYHSSYGIGHGDLKMLEDTLGENLGLESTEI